MQLRILGSGSGLPVVGKGQAAILAEMSIGNILFDCGEGTTYKLLELEFSPDYLDVVVISHMHPDHASGLPMLLQMLYLQKRTKPLTVYVPEDRERLLRILRDFYLFEDKFHFELAIKEMNEISDDFNQIKAIKNEHLIGYTSLIKQYQLDNSMNSFSFLISDGGRKLIYSSDVPDLKHLSKYINDVDCVIVDAIHTTLEEIKSLCETRIKRIILNHGITEEIEQYITTSKNNGVEIANEGEIISCT